MALPGHVATIALFPLVERVASGMHLPLRLAPNLDGPLDYPSPSALRVLDQSFQDVAGAPYPARLYGDLTTFSGDKQHGNVPPLLHELGSRISTGRRKRTACPLRVRRRSPSDPSRTRQARTVTRTTSEPGRKTLSLCFAAGSLTHGDTVFRGSNREKTRCEYPMT